MKAPSRGRVLAARIIAVVADAVQLGFLPLFVEGAASGLDDGLDVVVGAAMVTLLGWHWAFLPAFLAELVPGLDLAPTWTIAAFIATRSSDQSEIHPPSPSDAGRGKA
ncbi:MAG TPA: hypothetical protein VGG65_02530 [Thermoanaerobaculia bacterium]